MLMSGKAWYKRRRQPNPLPAATEPDFLKKTKYWLTKR